MADNGRTSRYAYDDQGQRVLKAGPGGRTAYINRYYSVRNGAIATKHVFAGNNRLASVVHPGGAEAVTSAPASDGFFSDGKPGNDRAKDALKNPAFGGQTPGGFEGGHPGQGTGNRSGTGDERSSNVEQNPHLGEGTAGIDPTANFRYYYHSDHLGSTNYVTDPSGALYQHLQYFPFGETWVDQRTETRRLRHLFTGKELDEETGLYYFGARYYDSRANVWTRPDPVLEKYLPGRGKAKPAKLPGEGGVYASVNLGMYGYSGQNPMVYVDPDGNVRVMDALTSAWGMVSSGAGVLVGSAITTGGAGMVLAPEPLTSAAGVPVTAWGGLMTTRSAANFGLSANNFMAAIRETEGGPGSVSRAAANYIAPGNENAEAIADVASLGMDLTTGRVKFSRYTDDLGRERFGDIASMANRKAAKESVRGVPGVSMTDATGTSNLVRGLNILQFGDVMRIGGEHLPEIPGNKEKDGP